MYVSKYDGIYFIEGEIDNARTIKSVAIELNGVFSQTQLKTLDDVKKQMVSMAKKYNANAIIDFKYGQKSSFWKSIFSLDDVQWYGSGVIANISEDEIKNFY